MFALVVAFALGVCNDHDVHCHSWMLDGQCESNAEFMRTNCAISCGFCGIWIYSGGEPNTKDGVPTCADTEPHCHEWFKQGHCESNPTFMLNSCPVQCGICSPVCTESHGGFVTNPEHNGTVCDKWASRGDCETNPDFMYPHCPVACGVCKLRCKDLHVSCSAWAHKGECASNEKFMAKHCPKACSMCPDSEVDEEAKKKKKKTPEHGHVCRDLGPKEECAQWKTEGQCEENPVWMMRRCAHTCGLCLMTCEDAEPDCKGWAEKGCDDNKLFMRRTCPASCGTCQAMVDVVSESTSDRQRKNASKEEL